MFWSKHCYKIGHVRYSVTRDLQAFNIHRVTNKKYDPNTETIARIISIFCFIYLENLSCGLKINYTFWLVGITSLHLFKPISSWKICHYSYQIWISNRTQWMSIIFSWHFHESMNAHLLWIIMRNRFSTNARNLALFRIEHQFVPLHSCCQTFYGSR